MGSPRLSPTGTLLSAGEDLSQAGLTQYMMDVVFVIWTAQVSACAWSRAWWLLASVSWNRTILPKLPEGEAPQKHVVLCWHVDCVFLRFFSRYPLTLGISYSTSLHLTSSIESDLPKLPFKTALATAKPHHLQTQKVFREDSRRCKLDTRKAIKECRCKGSENFAIIMKEKKLYPAARPTHVIFAQ